MTARSSCWLSLLICIAAPASAAPKREVCPPLESATPILPFWDGEELWPSCPISSPIVSIGGRCLGDADCMQPCKAEVAHDGKVITTFVYTYAKKRLVTVKQTSYYGDKPVETDVECTRDKAGHLTACKSGSNEKKYEYAHGALARAGDRKFTRDAHGRLVSETWDSGTTIAFSYNSDGTLAKVVVSSDGSTVTKTLAYEHGRLASKHSQPSDTSFPAIDTKYAYDAAGRVTSESELRGAHDRKPSRVEPGPSETDAYKYDAHGRLVEQSRDVGGSKFVTTYQYECSK